MQTASTRARPRSWPLLCLLVLVGCQSESVEKQAPTKLAESIDPSKPYSELRFTILEPLENRRPEPQFTPGNFEFPSNPKHYFSIPNLTHENVDEYVAELNRLGIKRVELTNPTDYSDQPPKQRELLRTFFENCPPLEAFRIQNWQVSTLDLGRFLNESRQLRELHLTQCRMVGEKGMISYDKAWEFELKTLSVNSCYHAGDMFMARILDRTPNLGELNIREFFRSEPLTAYNWPFHKLKNLRKLSLFNSDRASDILRQLAPHAIGLESLSIDYCRNLSDYEWDAENFGSLTELKFRHCEDLPEHSVRGLLARLPRLKVLSISGCSQVPGHFFANLDMPGLEKLTLLGRQMDHVAVSKFVSESTDLRQLKVDRFDSNVFGRNTDLSNHLHLKTLEVRNGGAAASSIPTSVESLSMYCQLDNASIGNMLTRLKRLRSLDLAIYPVDPNEQDKPQGANEESVNDTEWDFSTLPLLTNLRLGHEGCNDELIRRALRAPRIERLAISRNSKITGEGWQYPESLKHLSLSSLDKLSGDCLNNLPNSIETIEIGRCDNLVGNLWDFSHLRNLTQLSFRHCRGLTSIGSGMSPSLESLTVFECPLRYIEFDFSKCARIWNLEFFECHNLPVDRLFATLTQDARVLRTLNLRACPNVKTKDWNLSHLSKTLVEIDYMEGESSLTGGIDEANWLILKKQLPDCKILR